MNIRNLRFMKLGMFITSYLPLYLILLLLQLEEYPITLGDKKIHLGATAFAIVLVFLCFISVIYTIDLIKTTGRETYRYEAFMYIRLDLIYFNPTWLIIGYRVYSTGNGDMIISNIPYGKLKQNIGNLLKSQYLVRGVYLIQKKDNLEIM